MKNLNIEALQKLSLEQLRQGKLSKSLKTIDRAIKMDKKRALGHFIKGRILQESGKLKASNLSYSTYITLEKKDPSSKFFRKAKFYLSLNYLKLRHFDEALQLYKFRHEEATLKIYDCLPKWEISIETGNVLIWAEQGIGDEIFFARFLPLLKKYRATFYLECDKRLHEIIKYNNPNLKLLDRSIIQDFKKFDFQIAFGDLFALFSEHINYLNRPYIKITVRPEIKMTADNYKNKTIVGVSWRTLSQEPEQQKLRNVDLIQLSKNLNRADTVLVILQPLVLESEIKELKDMGFEVINKFDATNDILAVFELISICDQILTNQGAVAHFAGAVGQNTLMFRPKNARWVWTQEIEKSFFYPSIKFLEHY